jgi:tRNA(fMet)-specific endonuclease VapC
MNYLLDTCIVSQFMRGNPGVQERLKNTPPRQIWISSITRMELEYGLLINPQRAVKLRPVLQVFLNVVETLAYSPDDAQMTAENPRRAQSQRYAYWGV